MFLKALPLMILFSLSANAYEARYVKNEIPADLGMMLANASQSTGVTFNSSDFLLVEERELATSTFKMWVQTVEGVPVGSTAVRFWLDQTGELKQAELHLDESAQKQKSRLSQKFLQAKFSKSALKSQQLSSFITKLVSQNVNKSTVDARVLGIKSRDEWRNGDLVRVVEVRARRGVHTLVVSLLQGTVIEQSYREFQMADQAFDANVFPIYEEVESTGQRLSTVPAQLKYVDALSPVLSSNDPFASLRSRRYSENDYNPILAQTADGRAAGAWSSEQLRSMADQLLAGLPTVANDFSNGLLLRGRYANINLHPDVVNAFPNVNFPFKASPGFLGAWKQGTDGSWEVVPSNGILGKPLMSAEEILNRVPVRLADHDTESYINNGFDEIQVYYAVTTLMDALNEMGLTDPEFSTKPFEAFLYDPDIGMRDNAYYNDNTINFTTYSPNSMNYARDNSTIWHELGHGIMDRMMGPFLRLADTGGLSEGMADFVAMLVIQHQTNNAAFPGKEGFRIINQTGFYLTNEVHDDGEAYGGTMNDILDGFIALEGRDGIFAMSDLTMETMRLTRNHPALTAQEWFNHMLFADELGSATRTPGAYRELILNALAGRNFTFEDSVKRGDLKIKIAGRELDSRGAGSRENPIRACSPTGVVNYDLNVSLEQGDEFGFVFPVTIKVEFLKGALQGAIHWVQEVQNPLTFTLNSANDSLPVTVSALMKCDEINQPDGSCKDYAYIQVYNKGESKPRAKKRFYLKIQDGNTNCK
ncbi:MAG: hypothetical protein K2P81_10550 [Bacteriovoracaceae bacterium]|nr:hypothetical protein [Bacteriovoracaceae bacterium]